MKYAIHILEEMEEQLKNEIDDRHIESRVTDVQVTRLEEIQVAILILESSKEIYELGKLMALKNIN